MNFVVEGQYWAPGNKQWKPCPEARLFDPLCGMENCGLGPPLLLWLDDKLCCTRLCMHEVDSEFIVIDLGL